MSKLFASSLTALLAVTSVAAGAQTAAPAPRVQSAAEALAQDAAEYARLNGVELAEAISRLRAQEQSVAATDRLQLVHADRLAGLSIEHHPEYRIVVLLTGDEPVADETVSAGGRAIPVVFRTGAAATRAQVMEALRTHQSAIRAALPRQQGMGFDPRTGSLALLVRKADADRYGADRIRVEAEALTGVPVLVRVLGEEDSDLSFGGGSRVVGIDPADGRRKACTTGFVVTNAAQTGILTAAHCPDALTYIDPEGGETPLSFVGAWGARYQDVQIHGSEQAQKPLFYADTSKKAVRTLTGWRNRTSTRVGDAVCHRGETSGYSCSQVEFTDYAPPGDLCAGPCEPVWVAVTGPTCRGGDSGGPVFVGTTAFGITKGANYARGRCRLYYYMSTDYLPESWRLLYDNGGAAAPPPHNRPERAPSS